MEPYVGSFAEPYLPAVPYPLFLLEGTDGLQGYGDLVWLLQPVRALKK